MARHKDLQPWVDYFKMLRTYEEKGFLLIEQEKYEAYVTQPALYTLAGCGFSNRELGMGIDVPHVMTQVGHLVRRLRTYTQWKASFSNGSYPSAKKPFAVHVVKDTVPYDLLQTIVLTTRHPWWKLWMPHDHFEIIDYRESSAISPAASKERDNGVPT